MVRSVLSKLSVEFGELRAAALAARWTIASPDGRWALVSTSLTASVAGAIAWLAIAAAPPSNAQAFAPRRVQAALPYELLAQLSGPRAAAAQQPDNSNPTVTASNIEAGPVDESLDNTLATERSGVATPDMPDVETRTITLDRGDTLPAVLTEAGVAPEDTMAVVNALARVYSLRNMRAGQTLNVTFSAPDDQAMGAAAASPGRLLVLSFLPSVDHMIAVRRTAEGAYAAEDIQKKLESRYHHGGATINSSLYQAAMEAGISADIVVEMIHMFSYEVDFQRDVHPGDSFEVFYNDFRTSDGQQAKMGDIRAATMILGGKRHTLYRFETKDGVEYFDAFGRSAKSMLMKTPIDDARISSRFGMRMHPILGYTRMHKGIDFAAPKGTPVMAAGSGTVKFAGVEHGYGNIVIVNHGNGYSTAYGHLSRFASGIHQGSRVRQGQVIAYVGATGEATGPHLHYEIRVDNQQVNPLTVKVAMGRQLHGKELKTYLAERTQVDQQEASMPLQKTVADAAGLRNSKAQ